MKHLISLRDMDGADAFEIVKRAQVYSDRGRVPERVLEGKVVGILFMKTSTRTRTAFSSGALRLGARIVSYGPGDLQLNTGESFEDTGVVLSQMIDALVLRTASDPRQMYALAKNSSIPIINAMSATEHPTQALADLGVLYKRYGKIEGLRVLYMGEGNNTASALALLLSKFRGNELYLHCPQGYGLDGGLLAVALREAEANGSRIVVSDSMDEIPSPVNVVYTTRWQTTGTEKHDRNWRASFAPFQVTSEVLACAKAEYFMHDLPAHRGEEVTAEVIDGPKSIVIEQAGFKMYSAMAILEWFLSSRR